MDHRIGEVFPYSCDLVLLFDNFDLLPDTDQQDSQRNSRSEEKVEQLADDKTMILLCPKTTLALIGTEKAKFVDHQLEEPIGYAQACIHMIGKAHFAGQMCIKYVGYQLNHGIFKEVKLL